MDKYNGEDEISNVNSDKQSKLNSSSIPLESSSMISKNIMATQPQPYSIPSSRKRRLISITIPVENSDNMRRLSSA